MPGKNPGINFAFLFYANCATNNVFKSSTK